MSENPPPQDPYGQQPPPYGQPGPYDQQPPPYGQPGPYGQPDLYGRALPGGGYASWIKRVGAYLIDGLLGTLAGFPLLIGYGILIANAEVTTDPDGTTTTTMSGGGGAAAILIAVGVITSLAFWIWNTCLRQGRTGYSIGKGALGIRLVSETTGQPVGGGMSFVRQIAHIVDSIPCDIGYLWPLWDGKRQTFADKLLKTIVINQPQG